jgi:hypothetical protein
MTTSTDMPTDFTSPLNREACLEMVGLLGTTITAERLVDLLLTVEHETAKRVHAELGLGSALIAQERSRQKQQLYWTPEHDDTHTDAELARAARCYIGFAAFQAAGFDPKLETIPDDFPWDDAWWKPSFDPIENLKKGGALVAAEIERLSRALLKD